MLRWENLTDRGVERKMRQYFRIRRRYRGTKGEENKRKKLILGNEAVNLLKTQGRSRNESVNEPEEGP